MHTNAHLFNERLVARLLHTLRIHAYTASTHIHSTSLAYIARLDPSLSAHAHKHSIVPHPFLYVHVINTHTHGQTFHGAKISCTCSDREAEQPTFLSRPGENTEYIV